MSVHAVAGLVPALNVPSVHRVHLVSSVVFSSLLPAVKYWASGHVVLLDSVCV